MISYSSGSHYHHLPHTSSFPENLIRDVLTERRRYMCESVKYLHLWQVSVDLNALVNSAAIHFLVRVLITSGFCSRTGLCFVLITIAAAAVLVLVSIRLPGLQCITLTLCSFNTSKAVVIGRNLPLHRILLLTFTSVAGLALNQLSNDMVSSTFSTQFFLE